MVKRIVDFSHHGDTIMKVFHDDIENKYIVTENNKTVYVTTNFYKAYDYCINRDQKYIEDLPQEGEGQTLYTKMDQKEDLEIGPEWNIKYM